MSASRIQDKLSRLVESQLPEFVRADYSTFVSFLKSYYEFLEQDQGAQELLQNARDYNDVDKTIDEFIDYFAKQYLTDIPKSVLGDKRLLIKRINDLYSSKGSENSYNLLFKLLFGKQVQLYYPGQQILKASDGKWTQRSSIFIEMVYGSPDEFVNNDCKVVNSNYISLLPVLEKRTIKEIIFSGDQRIFTTSTTKFELFFDNTNNPTISQNDVIQVGNSLAKVIPSSNKVKIVNGGKGFNVGDIINVEILNGTGAKLKVVKVSPGGTISALQYVSFGVNYPDIYYYNFSSQVARDEKAEFQITSEPNLTGNVQYNIDFFDKSVGNSDEGTITVFDYVSSGYLESFDYVGELLSTFKYVAGIYAPAPSTVDAILLVQKGIKNFYPGYFLNDDGFTSSDIHLEDEKLYQPFSYIISIDEQLKKYKKAVTDLLHPAGLRLNADYRLEIGINIYQQVTNTLSYIINDFIDRVITSENVLFNISKIISSANSVIDSNVFYSFDKALSSINSSTSDGNVFYSLDKALESANSINDGNVFYSLNKVLESANGTSDSNIFYSLSKVLESANSTNDSNIFYSLNKTVTSANGTSDSNIFYSLNKVLESINSSTSDANIRFNLNIALESINSSTNDANIFYSFNKNLSNTASTVDTDFRIDRAILLTSANGTSDSNIFYSLDKVLESANSTSDANIFFSLNKALESINSSTSDANVFYSFDKNLSNIISTIDTDFRIDRAILLSSANSASDSNITYSFNKVAESANATNDANVFYSLDRTALFATYGYDYEAETYAVQDSTVDPVSTTETFSYVKTP